MTLEDFKSNPRTKYTAEEYERLLNAKEEAESLLSDESMRELALRRPPPLGMVIL